MYKGIIFTLVLVIGGGATVAMADNSGPGDKLFGIKQTVEKVQIALAGEVKKDELRLKFADERAKELSETKSGTSTDDKNKIVVGVNSALVLLSSVSSSLSEEQSSKLKDITKELNALLATLPKDSTEDIKIEDDDDNSVVDIKKDQEHLRIGIKGDDSEDDLDEIEDDINDDSDGELDDDYEDGGGSVKPPVVSPPITTGSTYTMTDVKSHNTASNCWTAINGGVYNVTSWISQHPGGSQAIISLCGIDGSSAFNGQHGGQARPASELASFKIGVLK